MTKIVALDPSGNHLSQKEGSGTTGVAIWMDGIVTLLDVAASDYDVQEDYWLAISSLFYDADYLVFEGYKLYNHKGMGASTQSNSTLQTSQLIGFIRMEAHTYSIPYTIQFASDVKTRWSEKVMQSMGILDEKNKFKGKQTNPHKRDALKHLLHFRKYKLPKMEEVK